MIAIDIERLTKTYAGELFKPRVQALRGISFQVAEGETFGFIGQNGAGKTTTLKILMGLNRATSGTVRILGQSSEHVAIRARIGYLPEHPYFYDYLTPREFLTLYARLFGIKRFDPRPLLERVGLGADLNLRLRNFSKGMLQRIGIAQALVNNPDLLILDEPMSGLDPVGRRQLRDLLSTLKTQGKTIFFSSHIISDVETLCNHIAILHQGAIKASGQVSTLLNGGMGQKQVMLSGLSVAGFASIQSMGIRMTSLPGAPHILDRHAPQVQCVLPDTALWSVLDAARSDGAQLMSVTDARPSLEDFFMRVIAEGTPS